MRELVEPAGGRCGPSPAKPSARDALVSTRIVTDAGDAAAFGSSTLTRAAASSPSANRQRRADRGPVDHDVAIGSPVALAQRPARRSPPVLPRTWTRTSTRSLLASPRSGSVVTPRRDFLREADHQVLVGRSRNREHARRGKLIALALLEQRRILPAMQEVFISAAGQLLLDDLGLQELAVALHREPRNCSARRQRDRERPFPRPGFGVVEVEMQLGERERPPRPPPWHRRASRRGRCHRTRSASTGGATSRAGFCDVATNMVVTGVILPGRAATTGTGPVRRWRRRTGIGVGACTGGSDGEESDQAGSEAHWPL